METLNLWLVILLGGLATYAIRLSFILLHGRWQIPAWFKRALVYVPASVFFAIIVPNVFFYQEKLNLTWRNPQIPAAILATWVAWRTRKPFLSLAVGLSAFAVLYLLLR